MGWAPSVAGASRHPIFLHEVPRKDKLMSAPTSPVAQADGWRFETRFPIDKLSQKGSTASSGTKFKCFIGFSRGSQKFPRRARGTRSPRNQIRIPRARNLPLHL